MRRRDSELTQIKGIGPKIAAVLITEGIESTEHLAELTNADVDRLAKRWPGLVSRMQRERWREHAWAHRQAAATQTSVEQWLEPDEPSDHASSRPPKQVSVEVEEPNAVISPDLEYPSVRFG